MIIVSFIQLLFSLIIVSLDFRPKVGPWNAMVSSPQIGGLAERMGGSAGKRFSFGGSGLGF